LAQAQFAPRRIAKIRSRPCKSHFSAMASIKATTRTVTPAVQVAGKAEGSQAIEQRTRNTLLRKTKFCMFHQQGSCQFGKSCAFAHSLSEMNGAPDFSKTQLCKAFSEGRCEDLYCNFAHGLAELRSTSMCFKKKICIWNEKGKCRDGAQCRFAHGMAELRPPQGFQQEFLARQSSDSDNSMLSSQVGQQEFLARQFSDASTTYTGNVSVGSPASSKSSRRTKPKKVDNLVGLKNLLGTSRSAVNSSNSVCSGSSSDKVSQQSAADPMKIRMQSLSAPQEIQQGNVSHEMLASILAEVQMLNQQNTFNQRLALLEGDYLGLTTAPWQQQVGAMETNGSHSDLRAELVSLSQGIGMLTAQCNDIQERMQTSTCKGPPSYVTGMGQASNMSKPFPGPETMDLLWHMQM